MSSGEHARAYFDGLHLTYKPAKDDYADQRCANCYPHLCYPDDDGACRFCTCTEHAPKGSTAATGETP